MVKYSDLSDSIESLLDGKFRALGSFAVSAKSTTKDGVKLNFYAKNKNKTENFTGGLKFTETLKYEDFKLKLDGDIKEDGTFLNNGELTGPVNGLKGTYALTLLQKNETDKGPLKDASKEAKVVRNTFTGGLSYSHGDSNTDVNLSVTKKQLNDVDVSFDVASQLHKNVALGVKLSGRPFKKLSEEESEQYRKVFDGDVKLKLSTDDVSVVASLENAGTEPSLGVLRKVNDDLTVGCKFTRKLNNPLPFFYKGQKPEQEKSDAKWGLDFGFSLKTDSKSLLSGKVNNNGVLTGAYEFDVKENVRVALALETNVRELGKDAKVGVSVTFSE